MARPAAKKTETNSHLSAAVVEQIVDGEELGVAGPLSVRTSAHVRSALSQAIDTGTGDLIVHLVHAEVWDATGLGVIVGAHHRAARCGRRLVVADASPRLCRLIRATKLDRIIAVDDTNVPSFVRLAATA